MGLDLLDVTYRIETTFGISISSEELNGLVRDKDITVGDLYDVVLKKMHLRDVARNDIGLNYALWTEIRGLIRSVTNVPLEEVELKTPLENLFPRQTRRDDWQALRDACPYRVRKLEYPHIVRMTRFSLAAAMVVVEQFQVWQLPWVRWLWPLLGLLGIWMLTETYAKVLPLFASLRTNFPSGVTTVKDLCRAVLGASYVEICRDVDVPLDERYHAVWEQLVEILSDTLDVDDDAVSFRSRLVRDLGMT